MAPVVDIHFHLLGANDVPGCNLSSKARFGNPAGWIAGMLLGTLDQELMELIHPTGSCKLTSEAIWSRLTREIREARKVDGVVLLALDAIVNDAGQELMSDVCVSEDAAFDVVQRFGPGTGKNLYLGTSIHPNRLDACDRLDRARADRKAVLVKWVPSSQRIDPACGRYTAYYQKLAALGLPLLCHAGPESALPDKPRDETWNDPRRLIPALDAGVTVIVAHGAAHFLPKVLEGPYEAEYAPVLRDMLHNAQARGWKLYTDISACLITPYRAARVKELFDAIAEERFVYGSDFPIFTHDLSMGAFGRKIDADLAYEAFLSRNLLDKDVLSKRSVGIPASVFENTAKVLGI